MQPALQLLHARRGPGLAAEPALLTDGELAHLIAIAVQQLGITEVRFTGGEPLLRRGLGGLVAAAAALRPRPQISLTTNGIGLARLAGADLKDVTGSIRCRPSGGSGRWPWG